MTEIFEFDNYRDFLLKVIAEKKESWGLRSRLAQAAGCQRSFFSQVLSGQASFSLDHAAGIGQYLKLDDAQLEHFLDLVNRERAQSEALKDALDRRMRQRKKSRENLATRFSAPTLVSATDDQQFYYSSWFMPAIHILTGIEGDSTAESISKKLLLPLALVESALCRLMQMGLAQRRGNFWENTQKSIHLPKESPLIVPHHFNWRQQASQDLQMGKEDSIHYTALQSLSRKDLPQLRKLIRKMLEDSRSLVASSGKEELACLTCDFFVVSSSS